MLAWMNINGTMFSPQIELGIEYLLKSVKDGGRYGSTQATVLCLKALVKYAKMFGGIKGQGDFVLYLNNEKVHSVSFSEQLTSMNNIDFNDVLNDFIAYRAITGDVTLKVALENYSHNSAN